jgi:hypothetical protein
MRPGPFLVLFGAQRTSGTQLGVAAPGALACFYRLVWSFVFSLDFGLDKLAKLSSVGQQRVPLLQVKGDRESTETIHRNSPFSETLKLMRTGGRLIKHARYYWLLLAESHLARLFGGMLRRIVTLPVLAG